MIIAKKNIVVLVVIFLLFASDSLFAGYYHWVDENGVDHYSNVNTAREIKFQEKEEFNSGGYSSSGGGDSGEKGSRPKGSAKADIKEGKLTPLYKAIKENDLPQVKSIISGNGGLITKIGYKGWTPLHWAAANGSLESVEYLLEKGAKINIRHGLYDSTPLHYAIYYGKFEIVKLLVKRGADVNIDASPKSHLIGNSFGETALKSDMNGPPLLTAIIKGMERTSLPKRKAPKEPFEIPIYLIQNGADYNKSLRKGLTLYEYFCKNGRRVVIDYVLTQAGRPQPRYPITVTELSRVLNRMPQDESGKRYSYLSFFKKALEQNPGFATTKFTDQTFYGPIKNHTLLHDAMWCSNPDTLKLLIEYGADVNARNGKGKVPLHDAHTIHKMELLINNGANVNTKDNQGSTALHGLFSSDSWADEIKYLISKGASPYIRDNSGKSAIDIAEEKNYQHYLKILRGK